MGNSSGKMKRVEFVEITIKKRPTVMFSLTVFIYVLNFRLKM